MKQHTLVIFADSSVWASRFRYGARQLAARLPREELGIKDIRVAIHLGQSPPRRPIRQPRRLSAANSRLLQTVAETMDDPALRASLRRLSRRRQP